MRRLHQNISDVLPGLEPTERLNILCDFRGRGFPNPGGGSVETPMARPAAPTRYWPAYPGSGYRGNNGWKPNPRVPNPYLRPPGTGGPYPAKYPNPWVPKNHPYFRGPDLGRRTLPALLPGANRAVNAIARAHPYVRAALALVQAVEAADQWYSQPAFEIWSNDQWIYGGPNCTSIYPIDSYNMGVPWGFCALQAGIDPSQGSFRGFIEANPHMDVAGQTVTAYEHVSASWIHPWYGTPLHSWTRTAAPSIQGQMYPGEWMPQGPLVPWPDAATPTKPAPFAVIPYLPGRGNDVPPGHSPPYRPRPANPKRPPVGVRERKRTVPPGGGKFIGDMARFFADNLADVAAYLDCFE